MIQMIQKVRAWLQGRGESIGQKSLRQWMREQGVKEYPRHHYDREDEARSAVALVDDHTMVSYQRLVTLWQQVRYVDESSVAGALVECGTWRGGAAAMMALAHLAGGRAQRQLHLFDSFQGLPEPDSKTDGAPAVAYAGGRASAGLNAIGQCVAALDDARDLINRTARYPEELTRFHVGWFQDTVPACAGDLGPIALLRLDGDWYESTRICLQHLYPLVSSRGVVVIDDYGHWEGCRRAVNEFLARLPARPFLNHIDSTGRYLIVP